MLKWKSRENLTQFKGTAMSKALDELETFIQSFALKVSSLLKAQGT